MQSLLGLIIPGLTVRYFPHLNSYSCQGHFTEKPSLCLLTWIWRACSVFIFDCIIITLAMICSGKKFDTLTITATLKFEFLITTVKIFPNIKIASELPQDVVRSFSQIRLELSRLNSRSFLGILYQSHSLEK